MFSWPADAGRGLIVGKHQRLARILMAQVSQSSFPEGSYFSDRDGQKPLCPFSNGDIQKPKTGGFQGVAIIPAGSG